MDEKNAKRESFAIGFLEELFENIDTDLGVSKPSGHHHMKAKEREVQQLVENFNKNTIFDIKLGRKNEQFKDFNENLLAKLDVSSLVTWLKDLLKKLGKKYPSK